MGIQKENQIQNDEQKLKLGTEERNSAKYEDFYEEIVNLLIEGNYVGRKFDKLKRDLCKKYKLAKIPTNIEIYLRAPSHLRKTVRKAVVTKPVRSISGVSPIAIMTKPIACPHGKCVYCPGGPGSVFGDVPQSYTGREPASMRAIRNRFDAYLQVFNRLEQYVILGHNFTKNEVIIMGGTFPSFEFSYQNEFISLMYKAMNDFSDLFFVKKVSGESGKSDASRRSDGSKNDSKVELEFDLDKFIEFFELPADIHNKERTLKIQEKVLEIKKKNLDYESEKENDFSNLLDREKKRNEHSKLKCVGLTIETKPDWGLLEQGKQMLKLGTTRVELGVQTTDPRITKRTNRGHSQEDTINSIQILRDLGFKLNFHMMPGLPGSSIEKDVEMLKEVVRNSSYMPDMMKIYPCMVMKGTPLFELYKRGKFKPMGTKEAIEVISKFIEAGVPEWVRLMRVQRDIPTYRTEAGVDRTNLRQMLNSVLKERNVKCRDIRAREAKGKKIDFDAVELVVREYEASGGKEFFISFEDLKNDFILGFCRLRFPGQFLLDEISEGSALVRELHVYGEALAIGESSKEGAGKSDPGKEGLGKSDSGKGVSAQHKGFGRKLLAKAEEISKAAGKKKMVVISGVGVREYYYKYGYSLEGPYVVKKLS